MGKASLRNLLAHKGRLALSLLAVVLSAGFVAGTLIFTDTLQSSFEDLFAGTSSDVVVTPAETDAPTSNGQDGATVAPATVPASALGVVRGTDGIAAATGDVFVDGATIVGSDGEVVLANGPTFGTNWEPDARLTPLTMVEGAAPVGEGQMAIDKKAAEDGDLGVGDQTTVVTPDGVKQVTVVGIFTFGVNGSLNGATIAAFETPVAQEYMLDGSPDFTSISAAAAEGVTQDQAAANVKAALGSGLTVQTGTEAEDEAAADIKSSLAFFNIFLLFFAGVSVFVGVFLIVNTFAMIVAQRTRELALFRALGASRGQVRRSVLLEAMVVGLVGAILGVVGGMALAAALRALFGVIGLEFSGSLVVEPRTVIVALVVGLGATLVASWLPARRAARVAPVAALRDDMVATSKGLRKRAIASVVAVSVAALCLIGGLTADKVGTASSLVGLSFVISVLALIVVAPLLAAPFVRVLGAPFRGTFGRIAVANTLRNKRRTALTASALMVGLALVSAVSTLAASFVGSVDAAVDSTVKADFIVSNSNFLPMPAEVGDDLEAVPGMATVSRIRFAPVASFGANGSITGVDADSINDVTSLSMTEGTSDLTTAGSLLIDTTIATDRGLALGDVVELTFSNGETKPFTVTGIYEPEGFFSGLVVSNDELNATGTPALDTVIYAKVASDLDASSVRPAVDAAVANNPTVQVQDLSEFKDSFREQINFLLYIIYLLLALTLFIAVLGIVNTLALSVVERTREIGLLRAIGTSRRQLRRMIRIESLITSVFGAIVGMLLGVFFGQMLVRTLADLGLGVASTPWVNLIVFLVIAAIVGVLAAAWPAWRASRMDVLQAIATE